MPEKGSKVIEWGLRALPGLAIRRGYSRVALLRDVWAGLAVTVLLIPAGMGYAQAAGLPAVNGLYASAVPLLFYALVGPSRILVMGPDSSLAPLIAASVLPLVADDPARAVPYAAAMSIMAGLLCIVAGALKFGFLADLLSLPVRVGYLNGIGLAILVGQLPALCGFSTDANDVVGGAREFAQGVADGLVNRPSLALGAAALAVMVLLARVAPRAPAVFAAIALSAVAVTVFGLRDRGVPIVGRLPSGLPSPAWPGVAAGDLGVLLAGAFGIAMVSFADTSILSRAYAAQRGEDVDANRELVALGVVNVASGFARGFPVSASASRTPVIQAAGARTQMAGVFAAATIIGVLVFGADLGRVLARPALAAVVIYAAFKLVDATLVVWLARTSRTEFLLALAAFAAVALAGPARGVIIAVGISFMHFIARAWRPHSTVLARVDGLKGYHDAGRHPEGRQIPGLVLFRFDAPLFFANANAFREQVLSLTAPETGARWLVVTAEPITDVDATAATMLRDLAGELSARHVVLGFAELKGHVREKLERYGAGDAAPAEHTYRTVGEAVRDYVTSTGTHWIDWEDR